MQYLFEPISKVWDAWRGKLGRAFVTFDSSDPLITSETKPRIRVDVAETSFFEGREFRTFLELNIAAGATQVVRFTATKNFILHEQTLSIDSGSLRMSAVAGDGTPGGTFNVPLPVIGKNRMTERPAPYYEATSTLATGGTHTGGTEVEVLRLVAANATAQQSSVGAAVATERGLPAGTYYIRLQNVGSGAVVGIYSLFWEERV